MRVSTRRVATLAASLALGLGAATGFAACGDDEDDDSTTVEQTAPEQTETDGGGGGLGY